MYLTLDYYLVYRLLNRKYEKVHKAQWILLCNRWAVVYISIENNSY